MMEKKLHRIPEQAVFGGVAAGIGQYLQIDVVIVRVLFVVMLLLPIPPSLGWTGIIYIILWAVLPTGPAIEYTSSNTIFGGEPTTPVDPVADKKRSDQTVMILGGVLILFGIVMLVDDLPVWYRFKEYFWPIALIGVGAFLILRQKDRQAENREYPNTPPPPPANPVTPDPDPQPYRPFNAPADAGTHFPQDPELKKPDDEDDQIIKVN